MKLPLEGNTKKSKINTFNGNNKYTLRYITLKMIRKIIIITIIDSNNEAERIINDNNVTKNTNITTDNKATSIMEMMMIIIARSSNTITIIQATGVQFNKQIAK